MTDLSSVIQPGDCLLYKPNSIFGFLIAVKTWTSISHVEIALGYNVSVASRNGIGVGKFSTRFSGLVAIRRPRLPVDLAKAKAYFDKVKGQRYDWAGLLCFYLAVKQGAPDRQFCSEFAVNFYRAGGFEPVATHCLADHCAPSEFWESCEFDDVWPSAQTSAT